MPEIVQENPKKLNLVWKSTLKSLTLKFRPKEAHQEGLPKKGAIMVVSLMNLRII
jgi:hypothetical protein